MIGSKQSDLFGPLFDTIGFDRAYYVGANSDLAACEMPTTKAIEHFVNFGHRESRAVKTLPFSKGTAEMFSKKFSGLSEVTSSLCLHQLIQPDSQTYVWLPPDNNILDGIRHASLHPYFLIGDSHTNLLNFNSRVLDPSLLHIRDSLLTAIHLECTGASAYGLITPQSASGYGDKIRAWADSVNGTSASFIPALFMFGQVDVEFVWTFRRIRSAEYAYSMESFANFTTEIISRYSDFLEQIAHRLDPKAIRVCSIFPPCLSDAAWQEGYVNAHIGSRESTLAIDVLRAQIRKLEIPPLRERTKLHKHFNSQLQNACDRLGLIFLDMFTPMIGKSGIANPTFYAAHGGRDHHLNRAATSSIVTALLSDTL